MSSAAFRLGQELALFTYPNKVNPLLFMQLLGIHPQVSTYAVHIQVDRNHQVVMIVICYPGQHPLSAGPQTDCEDYFYGLPSEIQTQIIQVAKACTTIKSMNY